MEGKIIKKSVPNEPLVREKGDEKEIVVENERPNDDKNDQPLRGARNRIKRNKPFRMDSSDGSSKTERTETKPDGSIVRTIVEINGNQKKTTVITTKGGSTQTNTRIETIGSGGGRSGGNSGFGFSGFNDSGFDDFNKRWNEQVNQMNNFYNGWGNFGNNGNRNYYYEYSSGGNNNKGGSNKPNSNSNEWHYEWGTDSNNKKNNNNNNNKWEYDWGDNSNKKKDTKDNRRDDNSYKKNDSWNYEWGTDNYDNSNKNERRTETISGNEFQKSALEAHNKYRRKHHVGDLVLSKDLCNIAQRYAETMARTGNFSHSNAKYNGKNMGENLFACYGLKISGKMMTDDWYNEVNQYNFNNPGFVSGTGHFTQVVWKDSREVGFGYAQARDGYYYGVANYYPAGNYLNEFEDNVFPA